MITPRWTEVILAEDVTEALLGYAVELTDSRYGDGRIDWQDAISRLEGFEMPDGLLADFGTDMGSPAIEKIKKHVRKVRKDSPR